MTWIFSLSFSLFDWTYFLLTFVRCWMYCSSRYQGSLHLFFRFVSPSTRMWTVLCACIVGPWRATRACFFLHSSRRGGVTTSRRPAPAPTSPSLPISFPTQSRRDGSAFDYRWRRTRARDRVEALPVGARRRDPRCAREPRDRGWTQVYQRLWLDSVRPWCKLLRPRGHLAKFSTNDIVQRFSFCSSWFDSVQRWCKFFRPQDHVQGSLVCCHKRFDQQKLKIEQNLRSI